MSDERKFNIEDLDEFFRQGDCDKKEMVYIQQTTIGLQVVKGKQVLTPIGYERIKGTASIG